MKAKHGPLLVCGCPRSGTTLLRAILGSHSQIKMANEPELVSATIAAGRSLNDSIHLCEVQDYIRSICEARKSASAFVDSLPPGWVSELSRRTDRLAWKDVYEHLLQSSDNGVFGEKSLQNVFFVPQILQVYPAAQIVYLVRDPRDVAVSRFNKQATESTGVRRNEDWSAPVRGNWLPFAFWGATWQLWDDHAARFGSKNPSNVRSVRYEDLVTHPVRVVTDILSTINLNFEEGMLDVGARRTDPAASKYHHSNLTKPVLNTRVGSHRNYPRLLNAAVEYYARRGMKRHGYSFEASKSGLCRLITWSQVIRSGRELSRAVSNFRTTVIGRSALRHA